MYHILGLSSLGEGVWEIVPGITISTLEVEIVNQWRISGVENYDRVTVTSKLYT